MAREAQCRQQVNLWFKQQALNMRRLDQQEEAVYALMLQVSSERARLRRRQRLAALETQLPVVPRDVSLERVADEVYVTEVGMESDRCPHTNKAGRTPCCRITSNNLELLNLSNFQTTEDENTLSRNYQTWATMTSQAK